MCGLFGTVDTARRVVNDLCMTRLLLNIRRGVNIVVDMLDLVSNVLYRELETTFFANSMI